jgi:hypothetical protein
LEANGIPLQLVIEFFFICIVICSEKCQFGEEVTFCSCIQTGPARLSLLYSSPYSLPVMLEQYHKTEQECTFQAALTHLNFFETSDLSKWYSNFCLKENNGAAL